MLKRQSGVNQYAQRIISTAGTQDGLAWQNADGTWDGPIGENVAKAIARGYTSRNEFYRGYFFQVGKIMRGRSGNSVLHQRRKVSQHLVSETFVSLSFFLERTPLQPVTSNSFNSFLTN